MQLHMHDWPTSSFAEMRTRRSQICTCPPPPRPLVRRAPRAGTQAPDQRFLIPALVGDASFSGVFLGALSTARRADVCRVARRVWPLSCGFAAGFSVELLAHSAAQGMRTQCPDQRDPDGTGQRSVFGVLPWRPVGRYGRAFGARWFRSRLGTLQSRAVDLSGCEAAWRRRCGGPDQGDLGSLAGRAHHPADPAVLTPASGAPVSKDAADCVPRPWTRSRSLRGLPRMAEGHRAFSRAGYMGQSACAPVLTCGIPVGGSPFGTPGWSTLSDLAETR